MSNITTDSINGNYPIAGQDNSSQGFRDNFTSIKNNLNITKTEITELQTQGIFKSALTGITLNNDLNYTQLKDAQIIGFAKRINQIGTSAARVSGAQALDFSLAHVHAVFASATITLSFSNIPSTSGFEMLGDMRLILDITNTSSVDGGGSEVKLPSSVNISTINSTYIRAGAGGDAGLNIVKFPVAGVYIFDFSIRNSTSTVVYLDRISQLENKSILPFVVDGTLTVNADQVLDQATTGDSVAASITTHASAIITDGSNPYAISLASSGVVEGQIKVFVVKTKGSPNAVITVSNAGWKTSGSGTITFDAIGEGVTLQYIEAKWYCIGNNGAAFA